MITAKQAGEMATIVLASKKSEEDFKRCHDFVESLIKLHAKRGETVIHITAGWYPQPILKRVMDHLVLHGFEASFDTRAVFSIDWSRHTKVPK